MSTGSKNKLWNVKSDFVTHPEFLNTLPSVPCGPYFVNTTFAPSPFEKYATYKPSTLEKAYIWQPHLVNAGVKLDLVDSESVLIPSKVPPLHPLDAKYLHLTDKTSVRNKKRRVSADEKPWWLRNTVYLENNLYNQRRPAMKEESSAATLTASLIKMRSPFATETILESFENVKNQDAYLSSLKKFKPNAKDADIEWSIPILPDMLATLLTTTTADQRSVEIPPIPVRFDEEVDKLFSQKSAVDGVKLDAYRSILTNSRRSEKDALSISETALNISLVAPLVGSSDNSAFSTSKPVKSSLNAELFGDDDDEDEEADKAEENTIRQEGIPYKWVSDFKMEISKVKANDEYLLRVVTSSEDGVEPKAEYWPVKSRIELKRLPVEEWRVHEATVRRTV